MRGPLHVRIRAHLHDLVSEPLCSGHARYSLALESQLNKLAAVRKS